MSRHSVMAAAGLVLLGVCGPARGQGAGSVTLGKRYVNPLYGFSFRAPLGAQRKRDLSRSRLMTWTGRDEKTGAIAWTLTVLYVAEARMTGVDLKAYKDMVVATLKKEENFEIDASRVTRVAGQAAIDLEGLAGELRFWHRQLWVLIPAEPAASAPKASGQEPSPPRHFLIFRISGPVTAKGTMNAIVEAVAGSLNLFDPTEARKQRKENLARGEALLGSIAAEKLSEVIREAPQWYMLKWEDKAAGFLKIEEKQREYKGADGYVVTTWALAEIPKTPPSLIRREMFTTADRKLERWREYWQNGSGQQATNGAEDGLKASNVIVCDVDSGNGVYTLKKERVPEAIYMPRGLCLLMPRLLDLKKPASYSFATYTTYANDFDMRTFTVVGPEKVATPAGAVDGVRMLDKPAEDEEPTTLWVNAKGELLRMQSSDGLVMEASTEAAVLRRYPKAKLIILALDRKEPPKPAKPPAKAP